MTRNLLCILVIGSLTSGIAIAQNRTPNDGLSAARTTSAPVTITDIDEPLWELNFAGFGRYGPSYPASTDSQTNVVPLPFPIYRGKILRIGDETDKPVRTRIFRRDRVKLDLDFGLNFPVDSDDIDARTGMPDLDLLAEVGPELELQFREPVLGGNAFLAFQARGAISLDGVSPDWRGLIYSVEFKHNRPLWNEKTELLTRLTPELASQDYMDFFYGVDAIYATPNRPAYRAKSGYLGTRLSFVLRHKINAKVQFLTGLSLGFYGGAANDKSPLFTKETTNSVYAGVLWKFWESKRRAYE